MMDEIKRIARDALGLDLSDEDCQAIIALYDDGIDNPDEDREEISAFLARKAFMARPNLGLDPEAAEALWARCVAGEVSCLAYTDSLALADRAMADLFPAVEASAG